VTGQKQVKLKPGDTIGILGGGPIGPDAGNGRRAFSACAARCFHPDPDSPAFDVVLNATCAEYADVEALELFANDVNVITYEFENVPAAAAMILAARRPVLPNRTILETTRTASPKRISSNGWASARRLRRCVLGSGAARGDRENRPSRRDQDPPLRL